MSDELVQRLRKGIHGRQTTDLLNEAADRIEELEAALREIEKTYPEPASGGYIARRALEGKS